MVLAVCEPNLVVDNSQMKWGLQANGTLRGTIISKCL